MTFSSRIRWSGNKYVFYRLPEAFLEPRYGCPHLLDKPAFFEFARSSVIFGMHHHHASLILPCIQTPPFFASVTWRCYLSTYESTLESVFGNGTGATGSLRQDLWARVPKLISILSYPGCEYVWLRLGRKDITPHCGLQEARQLWSTIRFLF